MERAHRGWRLAALLGLGISLTAPVAAQQQAESPYLDIQWDSQVVRLMLPVPAGLCQADAKPDAAPIWSEYDTGNEWPHTLKPSMMRAMFYLAYDYYGMGLNHYFTLRQDVTPDFDKRFAVQKRLNGPWADGRIPPDYATAFMHATNSGALAGDLEIAEKWGGSATAIHFRHAVIDPFDLDLLGGRIQRFQAVGLSPRGLRASQMDIEFDPEDIRYCRIGTVRHIAGARRVLGPVLTEPSSYPGTLPEGKPDYAA